MHKTTVNKLAILGRLLLTPSEMVSSGELVETLEVSRQAIWKGIESLRAETIGIESVPNRGYRFVSPPSYDLSPSWLENSLAGCPLGHPILLFDSVGSTQEIAKEAARQGADGGLVGGRAADRERANGAKLALAYRRKHLRIHTPETEDPAHENTTGQPCRGTRCPHGS